MKNRKKFAQNLRANSRKKSDTEIIANKNLGQHFLFDAEILQEIAAPAQIEKDDFVLEIGPGLGTLTEILAPKAQKVIAVEFDKNLAQKLQNKFSKNEKVEIISQDFLHFDLEKLPKNYKIVANIPYNITGKIVEKIVASANLPRAAVLLVQKEVAERIAARPGKMSILAVATQLKMDVELGVIVAPEKFSPPPKVMSQTVILRALKTPRFGVNNSRNFDEKSFLRAVKAGFSERRKKLRSSLAGGLNLEKSQVQEILRAAQISPEKRAQELSLDDWYRVAASYAEFSSGEK